MFGKVIFGRVIFGDFSYIYYSVGNVVGIEIMWCRDVWFF